MTRRIRLGVNIDHVATIRNARGGSHPDPERAAALATEAGADGITLHLREDRRHIRDGDLDRIRAATDLPLNMEMGAAPEMLEIALRFKPETAMFVPEKRAELTTEGGLDAARGHNHLADYVRKLKENGSRVSMFIEPDPVQLLAAHRMDADITEFHTGRYVELVQAGEAELAAAELGRIQSCAEEAVRIGIEPQAGHGLTYDTVQAVAAIPEITELNIGHFLVGEAVFVGLGEAVRKMRLLMDEARGI